MDHLLGAIEYEQCKDAKGKVLTEMVIIGSEKVPCYVFRIQVNEDEFYEMASAVAGAVGGESAVAEVHKAWKLAPDASDPEDNGVRVFAYVTKAGELAKLTAEVSGLVYGKPAKVNAELLCVGEEDPQDKMYLTVKADIDGKSYGLDAKKTVNATRARVSSRIEVSLQLPDMPQYGFNAAINYNMLYCHSFLILDTFHTLQEHIFASVLNGIEYNGHNTNYGGSCRYTQFGRFLLYL